ncbi:MAG: putative transport system permease protein, partial [Actinomycetota bacterium]|nr:putative transport system permease protein [Actinomycetota bacterium]
MLGAGLGALRLAPWRRAPRLLWHFPAVWWSFAGAGAILALAFAVPPLYLATAASSSVAAQERGRCSWAAGLQATGGGVLGAAVDPASPALDVARPLLESAGRAVVEADGARGHLSDPLVTMEAGPIDLLPGPGHEFPETERLLFREHALEHVHVTARVPGDGFLMTTGEARTLELRPGSSLSVKADNGTVVHAPVVGLYDDLARQPRQDFWCSLDPLIHQRDPLGNNVPPPLLLATSSRAAVDLVQRL